MECIPSPWMTVVGEADWLVIVFWGYAVTLRSIYNDSFFFQHVSASSRFQDLFKQHKLLRTRYSKMETNRKYFLFKAQHYVITVFRNSGLKHNTHISLLKERIALH